MKKNRKPKKLSGTAPSGKIGGTNVPVERLTVWLEAGKSIDDFIEKYPTVRKDQIWEWLGSWSKPHLSQPPKPTLATAPKRKRILLPEFRKMMSRKPGNDVLQALDEDRRDR